MKPYQFAFHDRVSKTPLENKDFNLVNSGIKLTRHQKDSIFHKIQNNSGKSNYRLLGWVYPFKSFMKLYLVKYKYYEWVEIWAFDKMCIRNSWYTNSNIIKIIEMPTK